MSTTNHQPSSNQAQSPAPLRLTQSKQGLASSPTLAMNEAVAARRAAGHDNIIHLGFGEACFPLHPLLAEALARAARSTGYAPVLGLPTLRAAIAAYLGYTRGLSYAPGCIAVAPGSKPLLYVLVQLLQGDVLLPAPSWVSYAPHARLANRRVYLVETDPRDHHRLSPGALAEALERARHEGADPRILVVNTPSNPTGSMFTREDSEAIAGWSREQGITIISDEIYAELAHGRREHVSPARFYPEGCIVTGGLSKAFSAGGWRLGYAAIPPGDAGKRLMASLQALASEIWSSASTPVQEAAITAYSNNAELSAYVQSSARLHCYTTSRLYETLVQRGVDCPRPAGGFYLYPDFAAWRATLEKHGITTGEQLARFLLDEWDIAALPGTAFGDRPDALRLRLATSMLYAPDGAQSREEKEQAMWDMLAQAGTWTDVDETGEGARLKLPMLERAQKRLGEFIASLD
jgi:aspartate/methionine/tyrosine aminotransferase